MSESTFGEVMVDEAPSVGRALRLCGRALLRRCPNCGKGRLYDGWMTSRDHCEHCGLRYDRGERDFFYGAYMFNLVAAELAFVVLLVAVIVGTSPDTPWTAVTWGSVAMVLLAPLLLYPFTKALWLAFDLLFRPHRPGDEV